MGTERGRLAVSLVVVDRREVSTRVRKVEVEAGTPLRRTGYVQERLRSELHHASQVYQMHGSEKEGDWLTSQHCIWEPIRELHRLRPRRGSCQETGSRAWKHVALMLQACWSILSSLGTYCHDPDWGDRRRFLSGACSQDVRVGPGHLGTNLCRCLMSMSHVDINRLAPLSSNASYRMLHSVNDQTRSMTSS